MIGDKSVGKTCLAQRYLKNQFKEENLGTLGVSQGMKFITLNGHKIRLTVYDTAGAEQHQALTQNYYRNADGVLMCYDSTDMKSLEGITKWMDQISRNSKSTIIKYMVGNKVDLNKQVTTEMGQQKAMQYGFQFIETSAMTGQGVAESFEYITQDYINRLLADEQSEVAPSKKSVKLRSFNHASPEEEQKEARKKGRCCR